MSNYWEQLKEAYLCIHSEKYDEAQEKFQEIYNVIDADDLLEDTDEYRNYVSCLLGLGEIHMKKRDLEKSLEYYIEWEKLTWWKDFNILFNLGVVYTNLWDTENAKEVLDKAKEMEPNNPNLIRFLQQSGFSAPQEQEEGQWWQFDSSFEEKIKKMMEEIN